jgi:hypothetical protein
MNSFVSPLCLALALGSLIAAFTMVSRSEPEVDIAIHRARIEGNEDRSRVLEDDLENRRFWRRATIVALFGASGLFAVSAYLTLKPDRRVPPADIGGPASDSKVEGR